MLRRRSLFAENNEGSTYADKLYQEIHEYGRVKGHLDENVDICKLQDQERIIRMKDQITRSVLPNEKQEFLNSLPNMGSYIDNATKFLRSFDIYKEDVDTIKRTTDKVPSLLLR